MSWLVDNATVLSILLGLVAAAMVLIWRTNRQNKYLGYAAGALALIGLIWLLALFVPTDAKQLRSNVDAMADAVVEGKVDDLFKHISKDFHYKKMDMTRDQLYQAARGVIRRDQVGSIGITQFKVESVSRANKTAIVKFKVNPWDAKGGMMMPFLTRAEFVLEGDEWKLKGMQFYKASFDTEQEIGIPGM